VASCAINEPQNINEQQAATKNLFILVPFKVVKTGIATGPFLYGHSLTIILKRFSSLG
jgi:hypothetical protein